MVKKKIDMGEALDIASKAGKVIADIAACATSGFDTTKALQIVADAEALVAAVKDALAD